MTMEQPTLFDTERYREANEPSGTSLAEGNALRDTMDPFRQHMQRQGFTDNTISSFLLDMGLVMRHLGQGRSVGSITTDDLDAFLGWLAEGRGTPCSPKSYARRVTTLKVFFGWLHDVGVLLVNPAAKVVQLKATSPLPAVLSEGQIEEVLATTTDLMLGAKPDPRPHLLVTLVLHTGIKKGECMSIRLAHIDTSNPKAPVLWVRYDNPRYRLKERKLRLPAGFAGVLARYAEQYESKDVLFPCTARNLEYVLKDVAQRSGLAQGLSFEMLRWTCAVREFEAGVEHDLIRRKLGISPITWRDTLDKLTRLTEPAL